jgi:predicted phosphoribosyltransferase
MFKDRTDAGIALALKLKKYKGKDGVILAIPRGGVPVAAVLARELGMPMEVLLSKKIGHPLNPEYAIGAVSMEDRVITPHPDVDQEYIEKETVRIRKKLAENHHRFMGEKQSVPLDDKIVIIVDDGIATGNTLLSTLPMIRKQKPKKIIIAVPVAPGGAVLRLSRAVNEMVVALIPDAFYGVGGFYEDFRQVSDEEVVGYMTGQ